MRILWILFYISTILSGVAYSMEKEEEPDLSKGKEKTGVTFKLPKVPDDLREKTVVKTRIRKTKSIDAELPTLPYWIEFENQQEKEESPSQRRRTLSLFLNKKNSTPILRKENPRRRSLDSLFRTDSEFEIEQSKHKLFDMLSKSVYDSEAPFTTMVEEVEAWINIVYSAVPKQCVTMEDLVEKKYGLLKFFTHQWAEVAKLHDDLDNLRFANFKKNEIEADEKDYTMRVNVLDGEHFQRLATVALELANGMIETIELKKKKLERKDSKNKISKKKKPKLDYLKFKQKVLYNSAYAYCSEAKQYYENAIANGDRKAIPLKKKVNGYLIFLQSKIQSFKDYDFFENLIERSGRRIKNAQKLEKKLKSFGAFNDFLKAKEKKITSPRERAAFITKLNRRGDKKKITSIIDKETAKFQQNIDQDQNEFSQKIRDALKNLIKDKKKDTYYKAIIEYKINKQKFTYIQNLKKIENYYGKSSELIFKAFTINPKLQLLLTLKLNLKRMKSIHSKLKLLDQKIVIDELLIKSLKESLKTTKDTVVRIQKPIENSFKELYQ